MSTDRAPIELTAGGSQSDSRAPAPPPLDVVQAFVNTVDLLEDGSDVLSDADSLTAWLARQELIETDARADDGDLRQAIAVREAIRALLVANAGGPIEPGAVEILNQAAGDARLGVVFDEEGGASLRPAASGVAGALGRIVAVVFAAMADGTWARLKACRLDACRWAYYDTSKNRSGAWCSMATCGNRVKTRAYRARRSK
jgi:predicted RNA-binding Zn ribbon-like protein